MVEVNVAQQVANGDLRTLVLDVFPNRKARQNPISLHVGGVSTSEVKSTGYRIDMALGSFNGHLLVEHQCDAHFSPDGIDLTPTADMAFVAAIMAERWLEATDLSDLAFCGEVRDQGFVPLPNPLQAGMLARAHQLTLVCPASSAPMAALTGARVLGLATVQELADLVCGAPPPMATAPKDLPIVPGDGVDLRYVKGQAAPRRALEIAVAGGHNLLMVGPPGEGKSLLAKCIPTIAPPMSAEQMVEATSIHLQHGLLEEGLLGSRPVREVSPSATLPALVGGGHQDPYPGEASLAHHGVLFLDEILQFRPAVLEALRGPLQDGKVVINRVGWKITWPAAFQLVAACNPCPCGYWGHPHRACTCTPAQRRRYAARLSGPVVDRIPVRVWVHPLGDEKFEAPDGEPSAVVRERVLAARAAQEHRQGCTNDALGPAEQELIALSPAAREHLRRVAADQVLSTRAVDNLRKVARSVADLAGSELVEPEHLDEAVQFLEVRLPRE